MQESCSGVGSVSIHGLSGRCRRRTPRPNGLFLIVLQQVKTHTADAQSSTEGQQTHQLRTAQRAGLVRGVDGTMEHRSRNSSLTNDQPRVSYSDERVSYSAPFESE